jgi:hypothetical protein
MTDKEIKQLLKDASFHLADAAKRWPKYPAQAQNHLNAASYIIDEVYDYVYRPLGADDD